MTIPTALAVGQRYRMWLCSGSSSSLEMSDKVDFPRTFRTIPDDPQLGFALAAFIVGQGWRNVATLACADAYGQSLYNSFVQGAARFGINIRITQTFNLGATQATNQLNVIKDSGWRVIVYMGQTYEGKFLLAEARDMGLVGDNYVWVTGDGLASIFIGSQPRGLETIQLATNGLMIVFPAEKENANTLRLKEKWTAAYPDIAIPPYGLMWADCILALARGLIRLADTHGYANVAAGRHNGTLSDFLLPFEGVSGSVAFHQTTGDRLGEYTVFYGRDGVFIPSLSILPNYTQFRLRPLLYHSGTSLIPFDRAQPGPALYRWDDDRAGSVIAIVLVTASIMLAACGYIAVHRREQAVRHLSFAFLMLISIGCLCIVLSPLLNLGMATPELCAGNVAMLLTGVHLILACSAVKAYRIYFIFENAMLGKSKRITTKSLLLSVSVLMAVHFTLLAFFLALTPIQVREIPGSEPYLRCTPPLSISQPSALAIATSALIFVYLGLLSLVVLVLAFRTRNVSQQWGESIWLFYAMQTVALATVILIPFYALEVGNRATTAWLQLVLTVYAAGFAYYSLVGRVAVLVFIQKTNARLQAAVIGGSTTLGVAASMANEQSQKLALERRNGGGAGSSSGRGGQKSAGDGSVTGAQVAESVKVDGMHLVGQFAIKREDVLFSAWKVHELSVCFRQGIFFVHLQTVGQPPLAIC
ncbi:periplasmic binding protein-like I [Catenaria anguillulae PL171]|uniref:Periplasmic binding protein-like I n=1 Tax=Catenaria anguillulae PL171 TaxID=765915 RepID=A0A1Y2HME9_9FUNG|nr:periplasmic binding protein-like I [Catenaria anguillulae PL171]